MFKKIPVFIVLLTLSLSLLYAGGKKDQQVQQVQQPADRATLVFPLLHHFSAREYAEGQVTESERDIIVQAGLRAPSAGNRQPWLFTVVQDQDLVKQILPDATEGNILIVGSGLLDGSRNEAVMLDAGLAAQSMFIAAQALGLGARQYTNPALIGRANSLKDELGIPEDHTAIIVTRFGRLPAGVDAVSSASPRADPETKVVYR
ncbi:MAG: nitroreductase family protein [Treponema sp.]|nr:nitroreductase family protein [Treponema sp.]